MQRTQVADYNRNVSACLNEYLNCDKTKLSGSDGKKADSSRAASTGPQASPSVAPTTATRAYGACAENGSCYGDISGITGLPKTVPVQGYCVALCQAMRNRGRR